MKHIFDAYSKVLIATFSPWKNGKRLPINGNLEPMRDYFIPKVRKTVIIDQVYPGSDFVMPHVETYLQSKLMHTSRVSWWLYFLWPFLALNNTGATHIIFKLRDYLSVVDVGAREKNPFDIFIGFEAINALAGVTLRRFGKVKKVIYYVSDYSPHRYNVRWFNSLYLWLDRQAAIHADVIWDVSPAMQPARITAGLDRHKSAPVIVVPNALYPGQIQFADQRRMKKNSLVFMGTLGEENGPDIAIKALPTVRKKFPDATLHIIGGGSDERRLRRLTKTLHLERSVVFHGFITDRNKVSIAIRKYKVALAPYKHIFGSARLYGDATKIRVYMAAGLPTVTTRVPPLGKIVAKSGAAIIVNDDPEQLAHAICIVLSEHKRYASMRQAAMRFARDNTWEKEYTKALKSLQTV